MEVNTATAFLRLGLLLFLVNDIVFVVISNIANNGSYAQTSYSSAANSLRFSKPVNLTNNFRDSVYSQVASHGNNVYMVWQENPPSPIQGTDSVNYDIFIKKSTDGGLTFGKEVNLSNNPGFSEHPQIAASGNNVYVVWIDNSPSIGSSDATGNKKILFRKSIDDGNTFGETVILSDIPNADSSNQEIAAAGNNVYIIWQVTPLPTEDQDSINGSNRQDSDNDNNSDKGSINVDRFSSISFIASVDNGETFKEVKCLTNTAFKSYPKIAAYRNDIYIVWNIGIIGDINNSNNANNNNNPNNGIFFIKSYDNGNTFSSLTKLNADWNSIGESQVAAYGNKVYVVWGGNPDGKVAGNLFYTTSSNNGANFSAPRSLTDKNTLNVEVAADVNFVYIAWQGVLPNDNEEIFFKKSSDAGATFAEVKENISKNEGISECTSITISEDTKKVYLAWEDSPAGNHEILFVRSL